MHLPMRLKVQSHLKKIPLMAGELRFLGVSELVLASWGESVEKTSEMRR